MCYGCWQEADAPTEVNENVLTLAAMVKDIDPYGHLHIIVDDWNLQDSHIESCRKYVAANFFEYGQIERDREVAFLDLMEKMSVKERHSALALAEGYFEVRDAKPPDPTKPSR